MASAAPMGQQLHESELRSAIARGFGDEWEIHDRPLLPLRATGRGGRRLPLRLVWAAPYPLATAIGAFAYGRADLVHRLDLRAPPSGQREVLTIHDLCPLRFDDEGSLPRWAARSARAAAAVICPSEFAATEVRDLLGVRRTHVVPNGVDFDDAAATRLTSSELCKLRLGGPLVVHAGGATARKNLELLAAAWPAVLAEHPDACLALCGPPHMRRDELLRGLPNARYLGYQPRPFVASLIRAATVVAVPSAYEGFGLPALEAMAGGVVVVAAACGALPEVCGDAALLVPPKPAEFAAAIGAAIVGGDAIDAVRAAGRARAALFSWDRAARETVAVYAGALA
jgi:glycosyltransferase involved in cell wall biosynthesis